MEGCALTEIGEKPDYNHSLVKLFFSEAAEGRRYALGLNSNSKALGEAVELVYIDDNAPKGTMWMGKPVVRFRNLPDDAIVVNCSMSTEPVTAHQQLEELEIEGVIAYADLLAAYPDLLPAPRFIGDTQCDLQRHHRAWRKLAVRLADEQSMQVLNDILRYRLTGDYRHLWNYSVRWEQRYFEDFLDLSGTGRFVDVGAGEGHVSMALIQQFPALEKAYLFEPKDALLVEAKRNLAEYNHVNFIAKALADRVDEIQIKALNNNDEPEEFMATATTLDNEIVEPISYIKMDLGGGELSALKGAERHIMENHPTIAVSVYHNAADFWKVPEYLLSLRNDYKVYLRHYTQGWSNTVMYFVPIRH
jgi:FkbM family methyltransferase